MGILNFSKDYTGGGVLNTIKSFLPIVCGVPLSAFSSVGKGKYSVVLRATPRGKMEPTIVMGAWLQEKIKFEVSSDWEPVVDMSDAGAIEDVFLLAGVSLSSTLTSRRKWKGSQPIKIFLELRFEALNDVKQEVITPCLKLQQLALPSRTEATSVSGVDFLLQPPGPNPFYLEALSGLKVGQHAPFGKGELIEIDIGDGFLKFGGADGGNGIIIKNVRITFDNRMCKDGPIGAKAELELETYEMLTRERLAKIYQIEDSISFTNYK